MHVIGNSEILNILSCVWGFVAVENWIASVLELAGFYFASEREPFKLKTAKLFLQMLYFVFLIFLSNMNGKMKSKLDE